MRVRRSFSPVPGPCLNQADIIAHERCFSREFSSFISFRSSALFLPAAFEHRGDILQSLSLGSAFYLPDEGSLLLPLLCEGSLLGVFTARDFEQEPSEEIVKIAGFVASQVMEKLLYLKRSITDASTGAAARGHFLQLLTEEIELVQSNMLPDFEVADFRACFTLLVIRPDAQPDRKTRRGAGFRERLMAAAAETLRSTLPEEAELGRIGDTDLAVMLTGCSTAKCESLLTSLDAAFRDASFYDPVTGSTIPYRTSSGSVRWPADMDGRDLRPDAAGQVEILLKKAAKAVDIAAECGGGVHFDFKRIVAEGGRIIETLPMQRALLNLGSETEIEEGRLFTVWACDCESRQSETTCTSDNRDLWRYKGEVVVVDVGEEVSLIEIIHTCDPSDPIVGGDRLLAADVKSVAGGPSFVSGRKDLLTELYPYKDFLGILAAESAGGSSFSLAMLRIPAKPRSYACLKDEELESRIRGVAASAAKRFGEDTVGGRFSLGGLLFYLPDTDGPTAESLCREALEGIRKELDITAACGVACHPFLSFSRFDALENSRKALDYALLLPEPKIGLINSTALNISADKLYAGGDLYEAIEEYKLALLADADNATAGNSLGACLAGIGRHAQAVKRFERVLELEPDNHSAMYNLGVCMLKMGRADEAAGAFADCLEQDENHAFSLLRLGSVVDDQGKREKAKELYLKAASLPGGKGPASRKLAAMAMDDGNTDEAGEFLHQALTHNPNDDAALHLMAKLYLQCGQDPEIAEAMARHSVSLRPDCPAYWEALADALHAQGKQDEAKRILVKAV